MPSKAELAHTAIHIEQDVLQESVGCQDQVMAAHGGLCRIDFFQGGEIGYTPIVMKPERLTLFQNHLLLYFTGFSRTASEIAKEQIERTKQRRVELFAMLQMVQEGVSLLVGDRDLSEFGELLHEGWMVKRSLTSKIATPMIDDIYDAARRAGALGGKLLGAGGGGFMLLSVTDQGYDIWTDNVWVNYDHPISSAEDDIVTVWGTITGTKSYDTQIGGSTYVPEMHARYISPG